MIQVNIKLKHILNWEEQAEHDWNWTIVTAVAVWNFEFPRITYWGFLVKYVNYKSMIEKITFGAAKYC